MVATVSGHNADDYRFRVVIVYDDPRAGIWRGPWENRESAYRRLIQETDRGVRRRVYMDTR
jgi:hypothetical protein